jgi:hypothetical protein
MSVFLVGFFNFLLVGIVYKLFSAFLHYNESATAAQKN